MFIFGSGGSAGGGGTSSDDALNVKNSPFNAAGNGTTDDTAAIQACFDAAFGAAASPHGVTNAHLNRPVFFPSGSYKCTAPLHLTDVYGARIYGSGQQSTEILFTAGSGTTSGLMINGMRDCTLHDFAVHMITTSGVAVDLDWAGTSAVGLGGNLFYSWGAGFLPAATSGAITLRIGHSGNDGDENQFLRCSLGGGIAVLVEHGEANLFQGGAYGACPVANFKCVGGSINVETISLDNPSPICFLISTTSPCTIQGVRTESTDTFLSCTSARIYMHTCQTSVGVTTIAALSSTSSVVFDSCSMGGVITGTAGNKIYMRGSYLPDANLLTGYTGTVSQNI